jgi:predicted small metal-binding protein
LPQIFESHEIPCCIRCRDVGLDCNHVIFGSSKKKAMENAIGHMFEYHAINPEEMTTCMKLKIVEKIHKPSPHTSTNLFRNLNAEIITFA